MKYLILVLTVFCMNITAVSADVLADVKGRGFIKVGISLGGMPMGGRDGRNEAIGYDVDVAKRLADRLGVELRIVDVYGDARVSMLVSKQLDIVIGNMTITEAREKVVDFSNPYYKTGLKIAVQKGSGIKNIDDLDGKKVVVGRGTSGAIFLSENAPNTELVYTDNFAPNGILLMRQRRVDAGIEDGSTIDFLVSQIGSLEVMPGEFLSGDIGMGLSKQEPQLLEWTNGFIAEYISSGDFVKYYHKWWGDEATPPNLTP